MADYMTTYIAFFLDFNLANSETIRSKSVP